MKNYHTLINEKIILHSESLESVKPSISRMEIAAKQFRDNATETSRLQRLLKAANSKIGEFKI